MKPKIYEDIIGENKNLDNIKENSYKLQKKKVIE